MSVTLSDINPSPAFSHEYPGQVRPHPREKREQAFKLFQQGKPQIDIAYELQIPAATVRAWMKRDHWEQRVAVEKVVTLDAVTAQSVSRALVETKPDTLAEVQRMDLAEKQAEYESLMAAKAVEMARHIAELPPDQVLLGSDRINKTDQWTRKALRLTEDKVHTVVQIALLSDSTDKPTLSRIKTTSTQPAIEV